MKHAYSLTAAGALICLAGCVTAPKTALVQPVGPAPTAAPTGARSGSLRVYSARNQTDMDPNAGERLWDENFGQNEYLAEQPHTDYAIYSWSGKFLRRVHNASEPDAAQPALATLAPGLYQIQAQAEDKGGEITRVLIPVEVAPGKCTTVHLEGNWEPSGRYSDSEVVRLPDGQIAGWLAQGAQPMRGLTRTQAGLQSHA